MLTTRNELPRLALVESNPEVCAVWALLCRAQVEVSLQPLLQGSLKLLVLHPALLILKSKLSTQQGEPMVREAVDALAAQGLGCDIVGGGGTGSYYFEGNSGVFNELQCGSYAFMDADYGRILDKQGNRIDDGEWENSLFLLTSVMSHAKADKAICDAGLKAQSVDSGLPVVYGRDDVEYIKCSDEHGVISDPQGVLKVNDKLKLVPGHCDPTCNVHDWYVGVRNGKVECLWPVTARGMAY